MAGLDLDYNAGDQFSAGWLNRLRALFRACLVKSDGSILIDPRADGQHLRVNLPEEADWRITGGANPYAAVEQWESTAGTWVAMPGGRIANLGADPLWERNKSPLVKAGTVVRARRDKRTAAWIFDRASCATPVPAAPVPAPSPPKPSPAPSPSPAPAPSPAPTPAPPPPAPAPPPPTKPFWPNPPIVFRAARPTPPKPTIPKPATPKPPIPKPATARPGPSAAPLPGRPTTPAVSPRPMPHPPYTLGQKPPAGSGTIVGGPGGL